MAIKINVGDRFSPVTSGFVTVWVVVSVYNDQETEHAVLIRESMPRDQRTLSFNALQDRRLFTRLPGNPAVANAS